MIIARVCPPLQLVNDGGQRRAQACHCPAPEQALCPPYDATRAETPIGTIRHGMPRVSAEPLARSWRVRYESAALMFTSRAPKCGGGASGRHQPTPVVSTSGSVSPVTFALSRHAPEPPAASTLIQSASATP